MIRSTNGGRSRVSDIRAGRRHGPVLRRRGAPAGGNLARDPRVGLSGFDTANPYHSIDIRGTAELITGFGR
jgi:hypothetical protein